MEIYKLDLDSSITDANGNTLYKIVIADYERAKIGRPKITDSWLGYATEDSKIDDSFVSSTSHIISSKLYNSEVGSSTVTGSEINNSHIYNCEITNSSIEFSDVSDSNVINSKIHRAIDAYNNRERFAYKCRIVRAEIRVSELYSVYANDSKIDDSKIWYGTIERSTIFGSHLSKEYGDKSNMKITNSTVNSAVLISALLKFANVCGDELQIFKKLGVGKRTLHLYKGHSNKYKNDSELRASTGCFNGTVAQLERRLYFKYFLHKPKIFKNYMRALEIYKSSIHKSSLSYENYKKHKIGFLQKANLIIRSFFLTQSDMDDIIERNNW